MPIIADHPQYHVAAAQERMFLSPNAVHDHRGTSKEMIRERGRQIVGASAIWRRYVSLITLERRYGEGWKASSGLVGEVVQNFLPRKQKCPPAHGWERVNGVWGVAHRDSATADRIAT
jgi:hypothetical protein